MPRPEGRGNLLACHSNLCEAHAQHGRFKPLLFEIKSMTTPANKRMTGSTSDDRGTTSSMSTEVDAGRGHERLARALSTRDPVEALVATQIGTERDHDLSDEVDEATGAAFPRSVASGDPTPTGVVLWTQIDPDAYDPDTPVRVELAREESFENLIYQGTVDSSGASHDCTIKVDLDGCLEPDERYYYRFVHDGHYSQTGRCTTLPDPDSSPENVRFAVLTCQDYQNGYFGAYNHIANEDVDFIIHVGDFIYESAAGHYKGPGSLEYPGRDLTLPSGHDRAWNIEDYRYLYRTYRSDEFLQAALEEHTLIPARDDHEFTNNIHWDDEARAPRGPDHPRGDDPEYMLQLTADALHAWWEYMPVRVERDPDAEALHEQFQLWNHYPFGDLLDLIMTDERLYRNRPSGRGLVPAWGSINPDRETPSRTMLGTVQREWLLDQLRNGDQTWKVWSDEVLTVPFRIGVPPLTIYPMQSGWDGYTQERHEILGALSEAGVSNVVTLTGDMHCAIGGYQLANPYEWMHRLDDEILNDPSIDDRIGIEFMTPAVTSINIAEAVKVSRGRLSAITERFLEWAIHAQNPHLKLFDSHHNGYSIVEFTPDECTYTAYSVDKTTNAPDADRTVFARLRVPEGRVAIEELPHGQSTSRDKDDTVKKQTSKREQAAQTQTAEERSSGVITAAATLLKRRFVRACRTGVRVLRESDIL